MILTFRYKKKLRQSLIFYAKYKTATKCSLIACLLSMALSQSALAAEHQKLANMCFACHGEQGTNEFKTIPNLRWQNKDYLTQQLHAFKDGSRQDKTMSKVAQLLSDDDIQRLAEYFYAIEEK